jgi:fluoroacetyl-CoA thioesterase
VKRSVAAKKRSKPARPAARSSKKPSEQPNSGEVAGDSKIRPGLEGSIERVVLHEWTIASLDPRLPAVLSTPHMIGLMEIAAAQAILAELPPGAISVGTRIEVDHLKAVPEGSTVRASARLTEHEGRFLIFEVEARSGVHVIGRGRVFRAIVEPRQFHADAHSRKS